MTPGGGYGVRPAAGAARRPRVRAPPAAAGCHRSNPTESVPHPIRPHPIAAAPDQAVLDPAAIVELRELIGGDEDELRGLVEDYLAEAPALLTTQTPRNLTGAPSDAAPSRRGAAAQAGTPRRRGGRSPPTALSAGIRASPHVVSMPTRLRTVQAPRLNPNRQIASPSR